MIQKLLVSSPGRSSLLPTPQPRSSCRRQPCSEIAGGAFGKMVSWVGFLLLARNKESSAMVDLEGGSTRLRGGMRTLGRGGKKAATGVLMNRLLP